MGTTLGSPIQINLDGKFRIPRQGVPHIVGEINPDLRLEHLDAFLGQINLLMKQDGESRDLETTTLPLSMENALARVLANAAKNIKMDTNAVSLVLEVDCEIDPQKNCMKYKFAVTGELR